MFILDFGCDVRIGSAQVCAPIIWWCGLCLYFCTLQPIGTSFYDYLLYLNTPTPVVKSPAQSNTFGRICLVAVCVRCVDLQTSFRFATCRYIFIIPRSRFSMKVNVSAVSPANRPITRVVQLPSTERRSRLHCKMVICVQCLTDVEMCLILFVSPNMYYRLRCRKSRRTHVQVP